MTRVLAGSTPWGLGMILPANLEMVNADLTFAGSFMEYIVKLCSLILC